MHISKSFLTTLATGAVAKPFTLLSIDSGTNIQYASINANDLTLAIDLPTTTYPPPPNLGINPASYTNETSFNLFTDGTILMNVQTTGVQYLYVSPQTGLARVTPAHTDYIPDGGISNFTISGVNLQFGDGTITPWACGPAAGPYHIFFNFPALNTADCREIALYVEYQTTDAYGAWQYI